MSLEIQELSRKVGTIPMHDAKFRRAHLIDRSTFEQRYGIQVKVNGRKWTFMAAAGKMMVFVHKADCDVEIARLRERAK